MYYNFTNYVICMKSDNSHLWIHYYIKLKYKTSLYRHNKGHMISIQYGGTKQKIS